MNDVNYLIVHKDHPISVRGVNSGAETATLWLARTLTKQGNRVVLCGQLRDGEQTDHGVEFWDLGANYDVAGALIRARELGQYHLIASCRAQAIIQSQREPSCISRTFMAHDPSAAATGIQPEILSRIADRIVCVSEAQRELFLRTKADPAKVVVVPNGADLELFSEGNPERRNYRRIVFVGALVVDKGIHLLINAFARLRQEFPDLTLDVYGTAAMWGREELFSHHEVERQIPGIKFHGALQQSEVARVFREAGAAIIPSIYFDSFPLSAVEAQAAGCPVVGFDAGGIRDAVRHGVTGILVKEVSEEALVQGIRDAIRDPAKLKQMAIAAAQNARASFSWDNSVDTLVKHINGTSAKRNTTSGTLGFLSTWNQECGLATYGRYLMNEFAGSDVVILAEDTPAQRTASDEPNVVRCWRRDSSDVAGLEAAIERYNIKLLHLNCHYRFFPQPSFAQFLNRVRARGVKVVALIHNPYSRDPQFEALAHAVDSIIVHTPENRLETIANGARAEQVIVIPHGVHATNPLSSQERNGLRAKLNLPANEKIIVCFGFVQRHKGVESLIEGVSHLVRRGIPARGVVVGRTMPGDASGSQYMAELKQFASAHGVLERITFLDRFVTDAEVTQYLQAADVALLHYLSQHYEATGAGALALGSGTPVVASIAPPFAGFADAVWHATSGFPVPLALEIVLANEAVRSTLQANAARYIAKTRWSAIAATLRTLYSELGFSLSNRVSAMNQQKKTPATSAPNQKLRVLIQNRPTTFTHRGGDTVVIERLSAGLREREVDVVVDVEGNADPKQFNLVHLFNFATPDLTRAAAERAHKAGVPFVVTSLCEDVENFHTQSHVAGQLLCEYVRSGQNDPWWQQVRMHINSAPKANAFDNRWIAEHAAAIYTNGSGESAVVRRLYGPSPRIVEIKLGSEVGARGDRALFEREFGVKDFILCVGRLETRKNQLMLLKALEHVDIPVVFAAGGFSYQPEYEAAVRAFKRKAQTLVLGKLSSEMLASAYAACRIHVLASWYELPGLVSLEAAAAGKNVVVTDRGTARDYLGEGAFFCDPSDEVSIRNAVLAAYNKPANGRVVEAACSHSWTTTVEETYMSYNAICGTGATMGACSSSAAVAPSEFDRLLSEGEEAAKTQQYAVALAKLVDAERLNPRSGRLFRARAAVQLAQGQHLEARPNFGIAYAYDSRDAKALCGLGMCEMMNDEIAHAYERFTLALQVDPMNLVALRQLLDCSYRLGRYDDLERALRVFIGRNPDDLEMRYCLAGCLFKTGRLAEADMVCSDVLAKNPSHFAANQLRTMIRDQSSGAQTPQRAPEQKTQAPQAVNVAPTITSPAGQAVTTPTTGILRQQAAKPAMPSRTELELVEIEDLKRSKKVPEARQKLASLQSSPLLTPELRERAAAIDAELMVLEGKLPEAEVAYRTILAGNPNSARALCGQGALLANDSKWSEAKARFTRALELSPGYDVALAGLGMCAAQEKNPSAAWDYYSKALAANVENKRAILGIMEIGYAEKRYGEVEEAIRQYLDLHPGDLNFMYALAGCLYAQQKLDEAQSEVEKVILFDPAHAKANELKSYIDAKRSGRPMPMAQGG